MFYVVTLMICGIVSFLIAFISDQDDKEKGILMFWGVLCLVLGSIWAFIG